MKAEEQELLAQMLREREWACVPPAVLTEDADEQVGKWTEQDERGIAFLMHDMNTNDHRVRRFQQLSGITDFRAINGFSTHFIRYFYSRTTGEQEPVCVWEGLTHQTWEQFTDTPNTGPKAHQRVKTALDALGLSFGMSPNHRLIREARRRLEESA